MSRGRRKRAPGSSSATPPSAPPARSRRRLILGGLALAAAVAAAVVVGRLRPAAESPPRSNPSGPRDDLLLVTLDTTRADRLGSYGYSRARTRHLDRLAAEGARFADATSPAPITLPAHASIFTGLYPFEHGVRNNGNFYLRDDVPTLATVLKAQGYRTAAFVSSFVLDRRYGLARGFDAYDDRMQGRQQRVIELEAERRGDRTSQALERWLEQQRGAAEPLFVWLHLYDPHEPYRPPRPFRDLFADSPYDGEIAFDDAIVAAVLDRVRQVGRLERTLVAVIADHGESLGDHGEETHSMFVYEAAVRVPLILWRPGRIPAGKVVSEPVRATDLAPTLLDLLGAPPLRTTHGRSLVPLLEGRGPAPAPAVYAETLLPRFYMNWAPLASLREGRWKFIDAPQPEFYDLQDDPGEARNLYPARPPQARALEEALRRLTGPGSGAMSTATLDQDAIEKLAALGYVGAGAEPAGPDPERARIEPKAMIEVFNRLRRANSAVRERRFADAIPILQDVLARDPRNAFARLVTASAYMGQERYREAILWFRRYLELVPTSAYAHQWLAICHVRLGERDQALKESAAALAIDPRFSDARLLRGGILAARGDYEGAVAELRAAIAADPAKPMLRLDLAKVLAEAGRAGEAEAEYEAVLRLQPDSAPALAGLAVLRLVQGRHDEAARHLTRALEIDPGAGEARFNLGRALEMKGDRQGARSQYERLLAQPEAPAAVKAAARERLAALGR